MSKIMGKIKESTWKDKSCDVCGENSNLEILQIRTENAPTRDGLYRFVQSDSLCKSCGFIFSGQVPEEAFLMQYYQTAFTRDSKYVEIAPPFESSIRITKINDFLEPGASIIEFGANDGAFCKSLRQAGYQAIGLDPLEADSSETGIKNAFVTDHLEIPPAEKGFDAIVSYYVLEHISDPKVWLETAMSFLKEGGFLFLEVPDFSRFPIESLHTEHFLHFTPFHLHYMLASVGFRVVEVNTKAMSRYFGFGIVALKDITSKPVLPRIPDDIVQIQRNIYDKWNHLHNQETDRLEELATELIKQTEQKNTTIIFWAANELSSRLGQSLLKKDYTNHIIVDNAFQKIGSYHAGFHKAVCSPESLVKNATPLLFVLCSQTWNSEILKQIEALAFLDHRIIDAVVWEKERSFRHEK